MKDIRVSIDTVLFLFSPFLSIPMIVRGIYKQKKVSMVLFCMIFGFISLAYIPVDSNDKAYYVGLFKLYQNMPPAEFFDSFLSQKTDVIFYTVLCLFTRLSLPFEFFSFIITFTTSYLLFSVLLEQTIVHKQSKSRAFLFFISTLLIISLPDLLSGMRNYLAVAFALYGINYFLNKNSILYGFIFLALSVLTHFSSIIYIFVFLMYYFFGFKSIKIIFCISIGFIFLPKQYLLDSLSVFQLSDVYNAKADAYLTENSFLENSLIVGNINNLLRIYFNNLWFYIALIFSIINLKSNNKKFVFLLCLMTGINIISSSIDLLTRYGYLASIVFLLIIFFEKELSYRNFFIYLIFLVNIISFLFNFMAIREPLVYSLSKIELLTLPTIFLIDATTQAGIK